MLYTYIKLYVIYVYKVYVLLPAVKKTGGGGFFIPSRTPPPYRINI